MIPYGKQTIDQADIDAVVETLNSPLITQGHKVPEFELKISNIEKSKHSVALNSATSALHAACYALGLKSGDYLWTSPISFVASANCGVYCGSKIDFVDIDPSTFNICTKELKIKLEIAAMENKLPKILVVVHLAGTSANMKEIHHLCRKYSVSIIEDASHAIGGKYHDEYIGNCKFSDVTVFSFHPVKIITTAEGGLCTTNSKKLFKKIESFRSHGIVRNKDEMRNSYHGPWYYEQQDIGYNYRLTDIQAALGLSQLNKLEYFVNKRNEICKDYENEFKDSNINFQNVPSECYSSRHLFIIQVPEVKHEKIFNGLRNKNIGVNIHYIPIHLQPFYSEMGFRKGDFINSETYYSKAISLPVYPLLSNQEQEFVIDSVRNYCENCYYSCKRRKQKN